MMHIYPEDLVLAKGMIPTAQAARRDKRCGWEKGFVVAADCAERRKPMGRRSPTVGRKVPRSAFVADRRAILKLVPKLRKIKPAKGR